MKNHAVVDPIPNKTLSNFIGSVPWWERGHHLGTLSMNSFTMFSPRLKFPLQSKIKIKSLRATLEVSAHTGQQPVMGYFSYGTPKLKLWDPLMYSHSLVTSIIMLTVVYIRPQITRRVIFLANIVRKGFPSIYVSLKNCMFALCTSRSCYLRNHIHKTKEFNFGQSSWNCLCVLFWFGWAIQQSQLHAFRRLVATIYRK